MGFEEPRIPEINLEEKKKEKKAIIEDGMIQREDGIWEDLETGEEIEDIDVK